MIILRPNFCVDQAWVNRIGANTGRASQAAVELGGEEHIGELGLFIGQQGIVEPAQHHVAPQDAHIAV